MGLGLCGNWANQMELQNDDVFTGSSSSFSCTAKQKRLDASNGGKFEEKKRNGNQAHRKGKRSNLNYKER